MPRFLPSAAAAALLALLAGETTALGIGDATNLTSLGDLLNVTVGVRLDAGEYLGSDCVAVEAHSGESRLPPSTLRWTLEPGAEPSERTLRIASSVAIDEPVVSLDLQFSCPTRLTRKYVVLIDPPALALSRTAPLTAPPAPRGERPAAPASSEAGGTPLAQSPAPAPAAPRSRRAPVKDPGARHTASRAGAGAAAPAARSGARAQKVAKATASPAGARLKLEATDDPAARQRLILRVAGAPAATSDAAASAPAAPASAAEEAAAQHARERLQALESDLAKLQAEGRAMQAGLAQLQARLGEAESQRYANGLVYALGAVAAALAAALGVVLWKRPPEQGATAPWWAVTGIRAADDVGHAPAPERAPARREVDDAPAAETTGSPMLLAQASSMRHETTAAGARVPASDPAMAVEELIDLEQQAEFFVVLGQDEAAVDLLTSHLRSSGGASPLPYLKLLEIFRRRGDREASERIRDQFNRRFNAYAPAWQDDPLQGRALTDYPAVIASLQALWATPGRAMRSIEASLLRRDGEDSTFDMPAYRELLFLYSVARDLAGREGKAPNVDLRLPGGAAGPAAALATRLRLSAGPVRIEPPAEVDVDITALETVPGADDDRRSDLRTASGPTSGRAALDFGRSTTRY